MILLTSDRKARSDIILLLNIIKDSFNVVKEVEVGVRPIQVTIEICIERVTEPSRLLLFLERSTGESCIAS